jgi:hypothetical protein
MPDPASIPPLRPDVDMIPVEIEGKPAYVLHDQEGIAKEVAALSPGGVALATLFDGKLTAEELQAELKKRMKVSIPVGRIREIAESLEKGNFLDTPAVRMERKRILDEFLGSPVRRSMLKGAGFPEDRLALADYLGKLLKHPKGPGKPLAGKPTLKAPLVGLVVPHIDLDRGGFAYAWGYQALSEAPPPDLVVALGVAHRSPNSPWTMTRKDYETPCGPMKTDPGLYDAVREQLWYDPAEDEWCHRKEHSLEYQALWLKSLWGEKAPPWLPILVSSFERFSPDKPPSSVQTVEKALAGIGALLERRSKKQDILILAGVDLAHVGPKFGDELKLGPELEKKVEADDRKSLEKALGLDADAFYLSCSGENAWRKVCGLSALYTALRWMKALGAEPGALLSYGQAPDPMGGTVSFASAAFR